LMRTLSTSRIAPSSPDFFYVAGCDVGKKHDFSVIAVVEKRGQELYLVHLKRFHLGTEYNSVIGYLKLLNERLKDLRRILIDQSGVGETFVEDVILRAGLKNARGVVFSGPKKQDILVYLKHTMEDGRLHIPFDRELMNELNVERFELTETGQVKFSHPEGTHDDRLWALALAVYVSRPEVPSYRPAIAFGKAIKPWWQTTMKPALKQQDNSTGLVICLTCGKPRVTGQEHVH
jgi:phage FluMu gp28-like protein